MESQRKDFSQNGRLAKVVDVGQSLKWCLLRERRPRPALEHCQNAILPHYTHTHTHTRTHRRRQESTVVGVWLLLNMHGYFVQSYAVT